MGVGQVECTGLQVSYHALLVGENAHLDAMDAIGVSTVVHHFACGASLPVVSTFLGSTRRSRLFTLPLRSR